MIGYVANASKQQINKLEIRFIILSTGKRVNFLLIPLREKLLIWLPGVLRKLRSTYAPRVSIRYILVPFSSRKYCDEE